MRGTGGNHAFYLSIPPKFFPDVIGQLKEHGLADAARRLAGAGSWSRSRSATTCESAQELNADHRPRSSRRSRSSASTTTSARRRCRTSWRCGSPTTLFEPIWNSNYVDHVQITMAEDIGIGGRAGYYDGIGAARDVIQNHLHAADGADRDGGAGLLRRARACGSRSRRCSRSVVLPRRLDLHTARGQYAAGWAGGEKVSGYLEEQDIPKTSTTETFAAIRLEIETRRWAGVPFYLRTGKRLGRRVTEVAVVFKRAPHLPFTKTATEELTQNAVVIRIQPDEGVTMRFGSKVPGTAMEIRDVNMDFAYGGSFTESSPEAYERLILDVLLGDPPLFPQHEEVELSWKILDPILEHWAEQELGKRKLEQYQSGTWGPESANEMLARDGRVWRRP